MKGIKKLKNKEKSIKKVIMPDIVIEEDIEGEKSECDIQVIWSSEEKVEVQNENIQQQPIYINNSLPQYQQNIEVYDHTIPQNLQQPLPPYNPNALQDPNVMALYNKLLESQQRVQQMHQFMQNNSQQIQHTVPQNPIKSEIVDQNNNPSQYSSQTDSSITYEDTQFNHRNTNNSQVNLEAQRQGNLNMFPSKLQDPQNLGLHHQISVNDIKKEPINSSKINEFLKENEEIKINNIDSSQSYISNQSYAKINQCYGDSKVLSETSSDSEYSSQEEIKRYNGEIDHTLVAPTAEGRKVILSKKENGNSGLHKYSHLLPGGNHQQNINSNSNSCSSSQFSEEFLNNGDYISESNNDTSSISSQSQKN